MIDIVMAGLLGTGVYLGIYALMLLTVKKEFKNIPNL